MSGLEIVTSSRRHDLDDQAREAFRSEWPEFIFHDAATSPYMGRVESYFTEYDIMLLDDGQVVAGGWGVPIQWDGTVAGLPDGGYDGTLIGAVTGLEDSDPVMAAAVRRDRQGAGLAGQVLTALRQRATAAGLERVIAPVRPALKNRYPLTPMAAFAQWARADGMHIDPWIRAHQRLGATILGPAPRSMLITGTVAEWEDWTKMAFPDTGKYVVPDALDLVSINREEDHGVYVETNLWMRHR